jgi:hypothetical protein
VHPGQGSRLALLCADGAKPDPACDVEVLGFADRNNPENKRPDGVPDHYSGWFRGLSGPVSEAPRLAGLRTSKSPPSSTTRPRATSCRQKSSVAGQPLRYGVAYVFFALAQRRLYPAPGMPDQASRPVRDRDTGALLDQNVRGRVTTLLCLRPGPQRQSSDREPRASMA